MLQRDKNAVIASIPKEELIMDPVADVHVNVNGNVTGKVNITLGEDTHLTVNVSADQSTDDKRHAVKAEPKFDQFEHMKSYKSPYTYNNWLGETRERWYVEITIPEGVTELPDYAFSGMVIIDMKLPRTLKKIGSLCFDGAVFNMPNVTFPESVGTIGERAFLGASGKNITLPSQVHYLKKETFYNSRFKSITCLGVDVILEECFSRININEDDEPCTVYLGDVVIIADFAFQSSRIRIPYLSSKVRNIGEWCFAGSNIDIATFGDPGANLKVLKACTFLNCNIVSISVPRGVTVIGDGCFANCINLYKIEIPDTVRELGWFCFYHCINLTEIDLPSGIEIGGFCFFYCSKLETVRIGGKKMKFELKYNLFKNDFYLDAVGSYKDRRYPGYINIRMIPYKGVEPYDTSFSFTNLVKDSLTSGEFLAATPPNHMYSERRDDYLFDFDYEKDEREVELYNKEQEEEEEDPSDYIENEEPVVTEGFEGDNTDDDIDLEDYDDDDFVEVTAVARYDDGTITFQLNQSLMETNREDPRKLLVQYDRRLATYAKGGYETTVYKYKVKYKNTKSPNCKNYRLVEYSDYNTEFLNRESARHDQLFEALLKMFAESIEFGFPFDENSFAKNYDKDDYPEDAYRPAYAALRHTFK